MDVFFQNTASHQFNACKLIHVKFLHISSHFFERTWQAAAIGGSQAEMTERALLKK